MCMLPTGSMLCSAMCQKNRMIYNEISFSTNYIPVPQIFSSSSLTCEHTGITSVSSKTNVRGRVELLCIDTGKKLAVETLNSSGKVLMIQLPLHPHTLHPAPPTQHTYLALLKEIWVSWEHKQLWTLLHGNFPSHTHWHPHFRWCKCILDLVRMDKEGELHWKTCKPCRIIKIKDKTLLPPRRGVTWPSGFSMMTFSVAACGLNINNLLLVMFCFNRHKHTHIYLLSLMVMRTASIAERALYILEGSQLFVAWL